MYIFTCPEQLFEPGGKASLAIANMGSEAYYSNDLFTQDIWGFLRGKRKRAVGGFKDDDHVWELVELLDAIILHTDGIPSYVGFVSYKDTREYVAHLLWPNDNRHDKENILYIRGIRPVSIEAVELLSIMGVKSFPQSLYCLDSKALVRCSKFGGSADSFIKLITDFSEDDTNVDDSAMFDVDSSDGEVEPTAEQLEKEAELISKSEVETTKPQVDKTQEINAVSEPNKVETQINAENLSPKELRVKELQRLATMFEEAAPKDLATLDRITRESSVEQIVEEYSERNSTKSPGVVAMRVKRIERDMALVKALKTLYMNKCQICGFTFKMGNGDYYSEAAHVTPISTRKVGVDTAGNILILCANHHKMLDYGGIKMTSLTECEIDGQVHQIKFKASSLKAASDFVSNQIESPEATIRREKIVQKHSEYSADFSVLNLSASVSKTGSYISEHKQNWPKGRGRV